MTTITQDVTDIAGADDNTSWTFYTKDIRLSDTGAAIISTKKVRKYPVAGVLTAELDPGPAAVTAPDGKTYTFIVPETDSELWPLIQAAVTIPPATTQQQLVEAVAGWMEVNAPDFKVVHIDSLAGASDEARKNAAVTALGSSPGLIVLGAKTYVWTTGLTFTHPGQGVVGQGAGATIIDFRGTGDCIRAYDSAANPTVYPANGHAGPIRGIQITGANNANTNIAGLHLGDLYGIYIQDVWVRKFATAGAKGFWGENVSTWAERAFIQMQSDDNTDAYVFDANASNVSGVASWDYSTYVLGMIVPKDCNGITVKNNTAMAGVDMTVVANFGLSTTTNAGVALTVGTTSSDTSFIRGHVLFESELNGTGTVGPTEIKVGAAARIDAYGALEFMSVGFQNGTASSSNVNFFGRINSVTLGTMAGTTPATNKSLAVVGTPIFLDAIIQNIRSGAATPGNGWPILQFLDNIGTGANGNWVVSENNVNGSAPKLRSAGSSDANVDLNLVTKGTGKVEANGVEVVTTSGAQTLIGPKTLTGPVIDAIKAANGWPLFALFDNVGGGGTANWLLTQNAPGGTAPVLQADGTDTDVDVNLVPKGAGRVRANSNIVGSWIAVPSTATSTGKVGQMAADSSFLYICTAANTWRRVAIASW